MSTNPLDQLRQAINQWLTTHEPNAILGGWVVSIEYMSPAPEAPDGIAHGTVWAAEPRATPAQTLGIAQLTAADIYDDLTQGTTNDLD